MEKHRCKLCFKTFSNGRALGGHMRSHLLNLPLEETESAPSASFSDDEEELDDHHHLGFVASSVVLQDRESETESSKNLTRRRSKRIRKSSSRLLNPNPPHEAKKKGRFVKVSSESCPEPEPVSSSISDVTTEEDVAFCLMMMSRDDKWKNGKENVKLYVDEEDEDDEDQEEDDEEDDDDDDEETDESDHGLENISKVNNKSRGKYRCETCSRTFRSYQALGGHRASHRKSQGAPLPEVAVVVAAAPAVKADPKVHQCPYCFRVFASGQALGGHKRSHAANYASTSVPEGKRVIPANPDSSMIDLNLPATMEDDESGQAELSALSDAEFVVDPYRHVR